MQTVSGFEEGDNFTRVDCKRSRTIYRLLSGAEIWKLADFSGRKRYAWRRTGRKKLCGTFHIFNLEADSDHISN